MPRWNPWRFPATCHLFLPVEMQDMVIANNMAFGNCEHVSATCIWQGNSAPQYATMTLYFTVIMASKIHSCRKRVELRHTRLRVRCGFRRFRAYRTALAGNVAVPNGTSRLFVFPIAAHPGRDRQAPLTMAAVRLQRERTLRDGYSSVWAIRTCSWRNTGIVPDVPVGNLR